MPGKLRFSPTGNVSRSIDIPPRAWREVAVTQGRSDAGIEYVQIVQEQQEISSAYLLLSGVGPMPAFPTAALQPRRESVLPSTAASSLSAVSVGCNAPTVPSRHESVTLADSPSDPVRSRLKGAAVLSETPPTSSIKPPGAKSVAPRRALQKGGAASRGAGLVQAHWTFTSETDVTRRYSKDDAMSLELAEQLFGFLQDALRSEGLSDYAALQFRVPVGGARNAGMVDLRARTQRIDRTGATVAVARASPDATEGGSWVRNVLASTLPVVRGAGGATPQWRCATVMGSAAYDARDTAALELVHAAYSICLGLALGLVCGGTAKRWVVLVPVRLAVAVGAKYTLDVVSMRQQNETTKKWRSVTRVGEPRMLHDPPPSAHSQSETCAGEAAGACAPSDAPETWEFMDADCRVQMFDVPKWSPEYKDVEGRFLGSSSGLILLRVQRVQNPDRWAEFVFKRKAMDRRRGPGGAGAREMWLFHGTRAESTALINTRNFRLAHRTPYIASSYRASVALRIAFCVLFFLILSFIHVLAV